ncbi:MAG: ABC transporter ATP-binding protein [Elusimicrobium sp.]|jgi:ABC-2 type transport system ATP-binding protein|nr:ABC transporter ATP-binding protein [Elusimicrobium sp.]
MNNVTVTAVVKHMKKTPALSGVSMTFGGGVINGIVGPNGAGKTTLLRCMANLLTPESGTIAFETGGQKLTPAQAKKFIAYFPQEPSLYPDLSCAEHMQFFRALYSLNAADFKKRSDGLFAATGMGRFRARKAGALSGGMYKKLGLMCVLLNNPEFLFLDEPTIGVDPVSRRELWELIHRFSAGGMNVVMSTSYMDEALRCGRVFVLNSGRLIAAGAPHKIMEDFKLKKFEDIFLK